LSRYSQLYIERGKPQQDSERMRNRLSVFVSNYLKQADTRLAIIQKIELEQGCRVPFGATGYMLNRFFEKAELRDVLDGMSAVLKVLSMNQQDRLAAHWRAHVARALQEENMAYRLGDDGIIHPFVDNEFERNRTTALLALNDMRFGEARNDFEQAFRHLRNGEGKQAIRMMFPAVETAAKVLHPAAFARLMPNEVDKHLLPRLESKYAGNQPASNAGRALLKAFKEWIIASQPYRHGQEVQEPAEPPQDFVVAHLSSGAVFLRWMIDLCE
jgi:hypothetical protein